MLELQALAIEVHLASIGEHIQAIAPTCVQRTQTNLNGGSGVTTHGHSGQLSGHNLAIVIRRQLLETSLHLEAFTLICAAGEYEFTKTIEGVRAAIEGNQMRITEDTSDAGCLIGHTILRRATLKAIGLATDSLLLLPVTARVEGTHVVEPHGQRRHFAGLVPWHLAQVVNTTRTRAPHLIVGQHQEAITIVATLLLCSLGTREGSERVRESIENI